MVLFPSKVACNIGTVVGSAALGTAGIYSGVRFEGIFEGWLSTSPALVFILQQVSLVYHLVPNCNLLECSCWQANTLASADVFSVALPGLTICATVHLVGGTCGVQQRSAVGPFGFVTLRVLLVFNCHLESTIPSPNLKSGNSQVNLF